MTEKNIFFINFFCCYIFQILVYFLCKNCRPPEKSHPFFPSNPPLKIEILSSPLFKNLVRGSTPLQQKGVVVHTMSQSNKRTKRAVEGGDDGAGGLDFSIWCMQSCTHTPHQHIYQTFYCIPVRPTAKQLK